MRQSGTPREVIQAVAQGSAITPMDYCKAQEKSSLTYSVLPDPLPLSLDIEQGTELFFGYYAATDTLLVVPEKRVDEGHWVSQFVE